MKKKRLIAAMLSLAMLLSLCACGQPQTADPVTPAPTQTTSPSPAVTDTPSPKPTSEPSPKPTSEPPPETTAEPSPDPTETPSQPPEPIDPEQEPPLDERAKNVAVPKFLTREQQALYRRANMLYRTMFGGDTHAIDDYQYNNDTVELNGMIYQISNGRYAEWTVFDAVIHSLFTDQFWVSKNSWGDGTETYINLDGKLAFISAARGGGYYYRHDVPDTFELISMSEEEIVFNLIGHYEVFPHNDEDIFFTAAFPIRMVRTEDGWRFDEFHDALADEIDENDPRADFDQPAETDFLLPVYSNTMAGGFHDLYRGAILAVDREGTLWQFNVLESDPYEPVWVMDNVATVATGFLRTLLITRDGTLYEWEFSNRYSQRQVELPAPVVYAAPGNGYSCLAITADGALWEWDHGPNGFAPVMKAEDINWAQYRYNLNDDDSLYVWDNVIPDVVQVSQCWVLQADGTLWHTGRESEQIPSGIITDSVTQLGVSEYGLLIRKNDNTYWYADFTQGNYGYSESEPPEFVCVYDPNLLLPVYPHTMDAGVDNDLYAVLDDGRLVMWGGEHYLQGGTFEDGPVVLMENVAAVYATGAGSGLNPCFVAIDKEGTLWALYGSGSLCHLNPDYTYDNRKTWEYPMKLMEGVAMIAGTTFWDYILMQDGTLWHWGGSDGFPGFYRHAWADPDNPGKPGNPGGLSLTKIMDNVIYVACGGEGGFAITADHVMWEWDSSHEIRKDAENVAWVFGFWGGDYLTTDGIYVDRSFVYDQKTGDRTEMEPILTEQVRQVLPTLGDSVKLIVLEDGSLLQRMHYRENEPPVTELIMSDVAQITTFDRNEGTLIRKTDGTYWYAEYSTNNIKPLSPIQVFPLPN